MLLTNRIKHIYSNLLFMSGLIAASITVSPGTLVLFDAPVGSRYDFARQQGQSIRIGPVDKATTYILSPEPASYGGAQATGYFDFPEPEWFILEAESVTIPKGESDTIPMWLSIPEDDGYYNHHWILGIPITPAVTATSRTQLQVGAYLLYRFETEAKAEVVPKCAPDEVVVVPSVIEFLDLSPGDSVTEVAEIFQGVEKAQLCSVERLDPKSEVATYTIEGTSGFPRLADTSWVEYPDIIVIPGTEEGGGIFPVTVKIPRDAQVRRFEEILILKGEGIRPAFVRIIVTTAQG